MTKNSTSNKPRIRASSLPQLFQCPASRILIPVAPQTDNSSAAAIRGDWCHWRAARTLIDDHGATPPDGGLCDEPRHHMTTYDEWMADFAVSEVLEHAGGDDAILVEQQFQADCGDFILSGHPDHQILTVNDAGEVIAAQTHDLKTGPIPVPPAEVNEQVLGYICLTQAAWPTIRKQTCRIVQPTNDDEDHPRVSEITLEGDELLEVYHAALKRIRAVLDDRTLNSDGNACKYCDAAAICPAIRKDIQLMRMKLTDEELERIQAEDGISPETIAIERDRNRIIASLGKISEVVKDRVNKAGGTLDVPGYRVESFKRKGRRTITDNRALWDRFKKLDVEEDFLFESIQFSLTPFEDYFAKARKIPKNSKDPDKETAKTIIRKAIDGIHEQQENTLLKIMETEEES